MYKILNRETNKHTRVTFSDMVAINGLNPKTAGKPTRRTYKPIQADRRNNIYPSKTWVANLFGLESLPDFDTSDDLPSSQLVTIAYLKHMYNYDAKVVNGRVVY
ncbi:MAG: hypothetical protein B7X95_05265 [Methylophilaceae bacterium 17-44-8]|nr:MAG: hypothetical protein B7X95_05265 [Methylophilaceae bacterium 17-44-8]